MNWKVLVAIEHRRASISKEDLLHMYREEIRMPQEEHL